MKRISSSPKTRDISRDEEKDAMRYDLVIEQEQRRSYSVLLIDLKIFDAHFYVQQARTSATF